MQPLLYKPVCHGKFWPVAQKNALLVASAFMTSIEDVCICSDSPALCQLISYALATANTFLCVFFGVLPCALPAAGLNYCPDSIEIHNNGNMRLTVDVHGDANCSSWDGRTLIPGGTLRCGVSTAGSSPPLPLS